MTYGKPTGTFEQLTAERTELLERIEKLKTAPRVVQIETSNALEARVNWIDRVIADRCPVNSLLQKDDRFSTDINRAIARAGASLLLLVATFGFVFVMTEPDEQVTGWMSNDAPVMEAK